MIQKKESLVPDFIQIPYTMVVDPNITPLDKTVYGIILFLSKAGKKMGNIITNTIIAELLDSSPNSIGNSIFRLEKNGYITRVFLDTRTRARRTKIIPLLIIKSSNKSLL